MLFRSKFGDDVVMSLVGQENELVQGGRAAMHDGIPVIDYTSTYSIAKAIFRSQNYIIAQLRYFENNLSRTSKQAEIYFMNCILIDKVIRRVYQFIDQTVYR